MRMCEVGTASHRVRHILSRRLAEFNKGVGNDVFNEDLDCEGRFFAGPIYDRPELTRTVLRDAINPELWGDFVTRLFIRAPVIKL
jgi:hypothetical protein